MEMKVGTGEGEGGRERGGDKGRPQFIFLVAITLIGSLCGVCMRLSQYEDNMVKTRTHLMRNRAK